MRRMYCSILIMILLVIVIIHYVIYYNFLHHKSISIPNCELLTFDYANNTTNPIQNCKDL